ncbi:YesL family protein [Bacillus carboniphilus]|uniref:YesL family protein n=1 Tax=Bacillus carboniphilus TaxID=86663 RepID=A0ABN0WGE1_9BACI
MELDGLAGGLYRISQKITQFFYINCLWFLFTLLGGIVLGFFPATTAMHAVMRKIIDNEDPPIFNTFKKTYFEEFKNSNLLGVILIGIIYMLYIDFQYVMLMDYSILSLALYAGLLTVGLLVGIISMYVFPLLAQHRLSVFQYIKYSCFIGISNPLITLSMGVALIFCVSLIKDLPVILLFFGSFISYVWMFFTMKIVRQLNTAVVKPREI